MVGHGAQFLRLVRRPETETHRFCGVFFVVSGDMQAQSEKDVLASYANVQADILKAPHHGSETSSTQAFLEAVNPRDVILSVGLNNDYGLPSEDVLKRYENMGFSIYRTDQLGTILIESDGVNYTIHN